MNYGIDMQVRQIIEDEQASALFERHLPGMLEWLKENGGFGGTSVRRLSYFMQGMCSGEDIDISVLSEENLKALDADLKKLGEENGWVSAAEKKRICLYQKIAEEDEEKRKKEEHDINDAVRPGQVWLDTRGERIQAHAGGMIYEDGIYYWYGENKEHTDGVSNIWTWGIRMYASKDFYNWSDLGLIIPPVLDDPNSDLFPEKRVDRPHIFKNEKTGKYVCWLKLCGASACFTVLTADQLTGPYHIVKEHYRPFEYNIGDFDISVNEEKQTAYLYCEVNHDEIVGIRLNDEYTEATEVVSHQYEHLKAPFCREGVTVFKRNRKLYMLTSGMTGYIPNQSDAAVADDYEEPFVSVGDPHVNDVSMASFNSQIGQVFKVPGKNDLYIAIADRWVPDYVVDAKRADAIRRVIGMGSDPKRYQATEEERQDLMRAPMLETANTSRADYVLLPIVFEDDRPQIAWKESWRLEDYN